MSWELIGVLALIVTAYAIGKGIGRGQAHADRPVRLTLVIDGNPVDGFVMFNLRPDYPTEETLP